MTTELLLRELETRGAQLFVDGELLRWKAPKGAIDAEMRAAVAEHKGELLELLSVPQDLGTEPTVDNAIIVTTDTLPVQCSLPAAALYSPALAAAEARKLYRLGKVTAAQRDALLQYAHEARDQ